MVYDNLIQYAQAHSIGVVPLPFSASWFSGEFYVWEPQTQRPAVGISPVDAPEYPEDSRNIILAHELGHAIDYATRPWAYADIQAILDWVAARYPPTPASKLNGVYHQITPMSVMDLEMRAWDHAIPLLDWAGFSNWDRFEELRVRALSSYMRKHKDFWSMLGRENSYDLF